MSVLLTSRRCTSMEGSALCCKVPCTTPGELPLTCPPTAGVSAAFPARLNTVQKVTGLTTHFIDNLYRHMIYNCIFSILCEPIITVWRSSLVPRVVDYCVEEGGLFHGIERTGGSLLTHAHILHFIHDRFLSGFPIL